MGENSTFPLYVGLLEKKTHELKLRYDFNTINSWRNAVSLVADISGFMLEVCNG
jgi:hypothetical protein